MMSLFNKPGGKAAVDHALAWHPNFRNAEQLPDTKTVRTRFFVNVVAITVVAALALYVGFRETKLATLKSELAGVEKEISDTKATSEKAVADYKVFQTEERRFAGANALVSNGFVFGNFLVHMGEILPPDVRISRVDFRGVGAVVNLSGSVRGLDARSSDIASDYVKILQADPLVTRHFASVTLTNLGRNVGEGNMNFDLVLTFKRAPAAGAKK